MSSSTFWAGRISDLRSRRPSVPSSCTTAEAVLSAFRLKSQAIDMPPMPAGKEGVARKIYARKESSGHYSMEKSSAYELPKLLFPASRVRPPIGGFLLDRTSDWVSRA